MDLNTRIVVFGILLGVLCGIGFGAARHAVILDILCAQIAILIGSTFIANHEVWTITKEYSSQYIESAPETFMVLSTFADFVQNKSYWLALAAMFAGLVPAQIVGVWIFRNARAPFDPKTLRGIYHLVFRISLVLLCGMISVAIAITHMIFFSEIEPSLEMLSDKSPADKAKLLSQLLPSDYLLSQADEYKVTMLVLPPVLYWIGVLCLRFVAFLARAVWTTRQEIGSAANRGIEGALRGALKGGSEFRSSFETMKGWGAERLRNARSPRDMQNEVEKS